MVKHLKFAGSNRTGIEQFTRAVKYRASSC